MILYFTVFSNVFHQTALHTWLPVLVILHRTKKTWYAAARDKLFGAVKLTIYENSNAYGVQLGVGTSGNLASNKEVKH